MDSSDFAGRHLLHVVEPDCREFLEGQGVGRDVPESATVLFGDDFVQGAGSLGLCGLERLGVGYRSGAAGVIDAYTACDGEQPGSEAPLLFVAMQVGVGADERLLQ